MPTAEIPDRGQAGRLTSAHAPGAQVRGQAGKPLSGAQARVGGPFLIPDDAGDGDLRPVSIRDVEALAARFDLKEPSSYTGEMRVESRAYYERAWYRPLVPSIVQETEYGRPAGRNSAFQRRISETGRPLGERSSSS